MYIFVRVCIYIYVYIVYMLYIRIFIYIHKCTYVPIYICLFWCMHMQCMQIYNIQICMISIIYNNIQILYLVFYIDPPENSHGQKMNKDRETDVL